MQVERRNSDALVENKLPDGSRVLVDAQSQSVFALNATAGAAWDACQSPATLSGITEEMQRSLGTSVVEELVEEAVLRLQEQNLVTVRGTSRAASSRRDFLLKLSAASVPLVVAMTMTEQRAYASVAQSLVTPPDPSPRDPSLGRDSSAGGRDYSESTLDSDPSGPAT